MVADLVAFNMNPALDLTTAAQNVTPTSKIRCGPVQFEPGGGGINVARVARTLGADALAVFPAGGFAGDVMRMLLEQSALPHRCVPIAGRTRQSLTVDEASSGQQYRFVFPGPELTASEQQACLDVLAESVKDARILVVTGSLPPGVRADFFQSIADLAQSRGIRLLLDTSGEALRSMRGGVHILKPSVRELQDCVRRQLRTLDEQVSAARELIDGGLSEIVVVSLGERGALLVTAERHEQFPSIDVPVQSAVGAGDSMVAGVAVGLLRGYDLRKSLRLGTAAGAATVLTPGTELCHRHDVERLFAEICRVEPVEADQSRYAAMEPSNERELSSDTESLAQLYRCFNTRDIDGALAVMHSDVSWANDLEGGYVHGHGGVREYWSRQWRMINTNAVPVKYTVRADGAIAVDVQLTARDAHGNLAYDNRGQHIFRIADGLITHFEVRISTGTRAHP